MRAISLVVALLTLSGASAFAQPAAQSLSQAALLRRMIDLDRLTTPPTAQRTGVFTSCAASKSAERPTPAYLRDEGSWHVMADIDGPGAITRIWADKPDGTLRMVIDKDMVFELPFRELFDGSRLPFGEPLSYTVGPDGGWNCYFPFGFATKCQVLVNDAAPQYEISYTRFAPATKVVPFSPTLDPDALDALDQVKHALLEGLSDKHLYGGRSMRSEGAQEDIKKGEPFQWTVDGAGVIRGLYIALTDPRENFEPYTFHRLVVRIWFDGDKKPAVEAPLCDFFGSGFDFRGFDSLPIGTEKWLDMPGARIKESRFMFCFFPMPFKSGAVIEIRNENDTKIGVHLYLRIDRAAPPENSLRFHARFHTENPSAGPTYSLLQTQGAGRIVGCLFNIDTPHTGWWGAAGEVTSFGGETAPHSTGVSAAAWFGDTAPLRAFIRPLHGCTITNPFGKTSAYRWYLGDSIEFANGAQLVWNNANEKRDAYVSTIAYWYAPPAATDSIRPLKNADLDVPGLRIPGAVEIEGNVTEKEQVSEVKQKYAGGVEFSGEAALAFKEAVPVKVMIPWPREETAKLYLRIPPRRPFESIKVSLDGKPLGEIKFDPRGGGIYPVGEIKLRKGDTTVTVECSKPAVLDCWIIEPAKPPAASQPQKS